MSESVDEQALRKEKAAVTRRLIEIGELLGEKNNEPQRLTIMMPPTGLAEIKRIAAHTCSGAQ
jgi:hypothetical protein